MQFHSSDRSMHCSIPSQRYSELMQPPPIAHLNWPIPQSINYYFDLIYLRFYGEGQITYRTISRLRRSSNPTFRRISNLRVCRYPAGRIGIRYSCRMGDGSSVRRFLADIGCDRRISTIKVCIFRLLRIGIRRMRIATCLDRGNGWFNVWALIIWVGSALGSSTKTFGVLIL